MKEKNEYQKSAALFMNDMLHVQTERFETEPFQKDGRTVVHQFEMCNINGLKFIAGRDLHGFFNGRYQTMLSHGSLKEGDAYHFVNKSGRIQVFVKLSALIDNKEKIYKDLASDGYGYEKFLEPIIKAAQSHEVGDFICADLERSETMYFNRNISLKQSKKLNEEIEAREFMAQEEAKAEERRRNDETLLDLVSRIESMGWHVTLTIKE